MTHLLIGGSGIVGSGFAEALHAAGEPVVRLRPPWSDPPGACHYIEDRVAGLIRGGPVTVIWAAGIGAVSSDPDDMGAEISALSALVESLKQSSRVTAGSRLIFSSSAGALYGGHGPTRIHDDSEPVPIAAFGFEKLDQEGICAELAEHGWGVLLARFSNVYGLSEGRVVRRGLIDTAVRAVRTATPMSIYVSPDSRRDYVYNVDAAQTCLDFSRALPVGCHRRIIAAGETVSVASVIATVGAVARRRVPATFGDRPYSSLQPRTLWFQPGPRPVQRPSTPMPVALHRMMMAPLAALGPR
jgi:UDP-glucose 4-epimerase